MQQKSRLTVDEARAFFETNTATVLTRSAKDNPLPFVLGETELQWIDAEGSSSDRQSCVDIPVEPEYEYIVTRENQEGKLYEVEASTKLVVVKSNSADSLAIYIRVSIPDKAYADLYDGHICDMTLNCENRGDYCGVEYYATLEGWPVAVARYTDGKYIGGVFMFDNSLSEAECIRRFGAILGNVWINRVVAGTTTRAVSDDREWIYGSPGTVFIDSNGGVYIYVDNDGDGKSDSVTQIFYFTNISDGGGSGGGLGDGPIGSRPIYDPIGGPIGSRPIYDPIGGPIGGPGDGPTDIPIKLAPPRIPPVTLPKPPRQIVDPLPWDGWISPGILPPDGNPNIVTNNNAIKALLDEIVKDCMGGKLIGALKDKVTIFFGGAGDSAGVLRVAPIEDANGKWIGNSYQINVNIVDWNTLIEELTHVHQYLGKNPALVHPYRLNNEIEAKLGWYMYGIRNGVFDAEAHGGYLGGDQGIPAFNELRQLYAKNDLQSIDFVNTYLRAESALRPAYPDEIYPYDPGRMNFPVLQNLMKDC